MDKCECSQYKNAIERIKQLERENSKFENRIKNCAMCQTRKRLEEKDALKKEEKLNSKVE
jgi:predicted nuclease with TOPRIM domain